MIQIEKEPLLISKLTFFFFNKDVSPTNFVCLLSKKIFRIQDTIKQNIVRNYNMLLVEKNFDSYTPNILHDDVNIDFF